MPTAAEKSPAHDTDSSNDYKYRFMFLLLCASHFSKHESLHVVTFVVSFSCSVFTCLMASFCTNYIILFFAIVFLSSSRQCDESNQNRASGRLVQSTSKFILKNRFSSLWTSNFQETSSSFVISGKKSIFPYKSKKLRLLLLLLL